MLLPRVRVVMSLTDQLTIGIPALAGAVLGFLRYNLPPARVFLGDGGSLVVGLVLGTLAVVTVGQ